MLFVFVDGLSSLRFVSFAVLVSEQVTFGSLQGLFWIFRTHCLWICSMDISSKYRCKLILG